MTVRPDRPVAGPEPDLLSCRMAILGLDLDAIARGDSRTFDVLKQRCLDCDVRDACTVDLQRDPNNPVWEAYCPNSPLLNSLTEAWWLPH